jgi:hypothetical protein
LPQTRAAATDENAPPGVSALRTAPEGDDVRDDAGTSGAGFDRRVVVLEPGVSRPTHDAEWHDALVMVTCGDVDLECAAGGRRRFAAGAVLWLAGIDIRVLHNVGVDPVVLVAVSRTGRADDRL